MSICVAINREAGPDVLADGEIEAIVEAVLRGEDCPEPCEVSVSFVAEDAIQELNRDYRGIDKPTDVLSFNIDEFDEDELADECDADAEDADEGDESDGLDGDYAFMLGDVILCPSVVCAQAAGFGNSVADEMRLLLVHGCLHLMGYDHEVPREAEEMEALERTYLAAFTGVPVEQVNVGPTVDHGAEGTAAVCGR